MWNPELDACDECHYCEYFLHEFWECVGETKPCPEFLYNVHKFGSEDILKVNGENE